MDPSWRKASYCFKPLRLITSIVESSPFFNIVTRFILSPCHSASWIARILCLCHYTVISSYSSTEGHGMNLSPSSENLLTSFQPLLSCAGGARKVAPTYCPGLPHLGHRRSSNGYCTSRSPSRTSLPTVHPPPHTPAPLSHLHHTRSPPPVQDWLPRRTLFLRLPPVPISKAVCNDTYINKPWAIVG